MQCLALLTEIVSQLQEKHFHTEGRGMERPQRNSTEHQCTPEPQVMVLPLSSNGLQIPTRSKKKTDNLPLLIINGQNPV